MIATPALLNFLARWRQGEKLAVLTAYDASGASLASAGGVDLILVGDSLGNVVQGMPTTASVTLDQMVYHTRMTARMAKVPVVADLPANTYDNPEIAVESARLLMAAGAHGVKFEGNPEGVAQAILAEGIPVMGHLGLLPQTAVGFKVHGKEADEAQKIRDDALALTKAGCFSLVLECVPLTLARQITEENPLPTIGIGAGPHTSGQVLVFHDLLGLSEGRKAKFVPQAYPSVGQLARSVIESYVRDVKAGVYPSDEESYH